LRRPPGYGDIAQTIISDDGEVRDPIEAALVPDLSLETPGSRERSPEDAHRISSAGGYPLDFEKKDGYSSRL
jgi:hypothetical protein